MLKRSFHVGSLPVGFLSNVVMSVGQWTFSTVGLAFPLSFNRVVLPGFRKDPSYKHPVKLHHKISKAHPPRPIRLFSFRYILQLFFHHLVFFPIIGFLAERPRPDTLVPPRVPDSHQLDIVLRKVSHVDDTVVVVLKNTLLTLFRVLYASGLAQVHATQKEFLVVEGVQAVPDLRIFNFLLTFFFRKLRQL